MYYPEPIARLIESFSKLPGIGQKTATRLAFYTIGMEDQDVNEFAKNLLSAKRDLSFCSICGNLTESDPCAICTDPTRDRTTILVVEESKDVLAMEKIREYRGLYHVLHGTISPMNGISPDEISDVITSTESLTRPPPREFHLFSGHHFVVPRRLSFMFAA